MNKNKKFVFTVIALVFSILTLSHTLIFVFFESSQTAGQAALINTGFALSVASWRALYNRGVSWEWVVLLWLNIVLHVVAEGNTIDTFVVIYNWWSS